MSDNPLPPESVAAETESLPSQAMQADEGPAGFQPQTSSETLRKLKEERESQTQRTLAIILVSMLGATAVVQYGSLWILTIYNRLDAMPHFEHAFNVWLPVLAGLVGTAVGFYLKERK